MCWNGNANAFDKESRRRVRGMHKVFVADTTADDTTTTTTST
jgi:hypothetical protein